MEKNKEKRAGYTTGKKECGDTLYMVCCLLLGA